jgi:aminoglycoside 6'-N-acetyltransferase
MFDFRPIARSDFPLLAHWLRQPHVARWWADDPSPEAMEADYGGCIDGTEPADVFIVNHAGRPFGLAQRLMLASYPEYQEALRPLLPLTPGSASIDYLVGEQGETGRGLGTAMIAAFVEKLWRDWPQATDLIVPVHAENRASWRALERAGFTRGCEGELDPDNPADSRAHVIYVIARAPK